VGFKGDNFFIENIGKNCSKNDKKSFLAKTAVSPFWRSTVDLSHKQADLMTGFMAN